MRARRLARLFAIVVLAPILLGALLLWYGLSSERVARRLIASALERAGDGITIGRVSGSIRGPLIVHDVAIRRASFAATIDSAVLDWTPTGLIHRQIRLDRLHATGVHITIPDSTPADTAAPRRPRLPMDVLLGDVLVRELSVDAPNEVRVRSGTLRLDGRAEDYRFVAEGALSMPRLENSRVVLAGTGNLEHVELDSASADVLEGTLGATGTVTWWPATTWELAIRASGVRPALLLEEPRAWPGTVAFAGRTAGRLDSIGPVGELVIDSLGGAIRNQPLGGHGIVRFAGLAATGSFEVRELDATWGSVRLTGSGALADTVHADYRLAIGSLGTALPAARGSLTASGTVRGSRAAPRIRTTFEGRRLGMGGNSALRASGRADLILAPSGRTDVDLRARGARLGPLALDSLSAAVRGTRQSHRITAGGGGPAGVSELALRGRFADREWSGRLDDLALDTRDFGNWSLQSPAAITATIGAAPRASIGNVCLTASATPEARACGSGAWLGRAGWRVAAVVDRLPLALFDSLLPDSALGDSQALAGTLTAVLDASSRAGALAGRMQLRADSAAFLYQRPLDTLPRRIAFDTAAAEITAGTGGIRGAASLRARQGDGSLIGTLEAVAELPRYTRLGSPLASQPVNARIDGRMDSLGFATELFPSLDSIAGRVTLATMVTGMAATPEIDGRLSFDSLFVWLPRGRAGQGSVEVSARGTVVNRREVTGRLTIVPRGVIYDYSLDDLPRRVVLDSGGAVLATGASGTAADLALGLSDTAGTRIVSASAAVRLPEYSALGGPVATQPMTFSLDAEIPDVGFARAATDRYDSLAGRITLHAAGAGRVGTPQVDGELRVEEFLARSLTGTITRANLLGTWALRVAPDSSLSGELRLVPSGVTFAYVESGAYETIALDTTTLQLSAGADGVRGAMDLAFADTTGRVLGRLDGQIALPDYRRYGAPLGPARLEARLSGRVDDLAFAEAFSPEVDSLAGRLELDVSMQGTVGDPTWTGGLGLRDAAMRLPLLGALYRDIHLGLTGTGTGEVRVEGRARSGEGELTLAGTTPVRPSAEKPGRLQLRGNRFEAINTADARAIISPALDVRLIADTIELTGRVDVPVARMELTEIPEFAVPPSDDVVFVGDTAAPRPARPIRAEVEVVLGDSVTFSGFNFNADLAGALRLFERPMEPTRASGAIIIEKGEYKAYGQDLTVTNGRVAFAGGPVDNPALSIRASRTADDGTVAGLQIGGTLKSPQVTIWSEPAMSQNTALHYIVMGRAPGEGSGADGSLLSRAASSVGLRGSSLLARSLGRGFGLDEARIESEEGFHEASFVAGAYLSPSLYVSYGIGLFDPISTLRLRYLLSQRWTLQAETGAETGADVVFKVD
ncbi:MAG TPA: translocation/assembly module TamB domain-containing protein [Gemmatimonadales bacterium]|nr:translocation/assembly module TamB domain-containing protein [Gemmatimonadales bacterium]